MGLQYRKVKTIRKNSGLLDSWFPAKYSTSPYMACSHGCIYCDGRAEKDHVQGDFEKEYQIPSLLPHKLFRNMLPVYDEYYTIFKHLFSLYHSSPNAIKRLSLSIKNFENGFHNRKEYGIKRDFF